MDKGEREKLLQEQEERRIAQLKREAEEDERRRKANREKKVLPHLHFQFVSPLLSDRKLKRRGN